MADTTYADENQNAWRLDVSSDGTTFNQVIGITDSNFPGITPGLKDSSSYDNQGWGSQAITSYSWSLEMTVLSKVDDSGATNDALSTLRDCIGEFGSDAQVHVRWGRTDGHTPFQGYSGVAYVSIAPGNTAWDDLRAEKITLAGDGKASKLSAEPTDWSGGGTP